MKTTKTYEIGLSLFIFLFAILLSSCVSKEEKENVAGLNAKYQDYYFKGIGE
jgi:hypothetical protein